MGTWGAGNFESDAALDYINEQVDRCVKVIAEVFGDSERFRLDEDAEGMLMPSASILILLCEQCHGVLPKELDAATWKARYLAMYDEQMPDMSATEEFARERRSVIADTFDALSSIHQRQWQTDGE
jgi:uncharacterized protein DUF4259